ncbi:oligosaccharide flippase family protein [Calothrix sp. PCC 7507]|uniref:oligosaccharide flippase family protein n=1 Tax=Calothrix sp. PCC 7507 TaxID=99598 RepID=UPI00029F4811|nr:oligosaccharide flippase family protein [Calothrix sp. PCC 7507]AFY35737.1 polysaccharide biosynthesis protein [Calothrix sp. PCC 7507]
MTPLKKLAVRSAIWTIFGYGTSQILRFASNLILTRLLVPEFFGLMALVTTLRVGLELFSDLGIGQSVVSNKRGDDTDFLNTAWTLQIIRGFIIWFFCLVVTVPVANFYGDTRLLWLIPIVGMNSVIDGFNSTTLYTVHRNLEMGRYTVFELILQAFSLSTLICLSWIYPSVFTLAISGLIASVVKMIASYWLIPGYKKNHFAWDKDAVTQIVSFGKWMFVASAVMFIAEQADRLILAKLLSFQMLGVYTVAYTLAGIPREVIKSLSTKVIFPTIANRVDLSRENLRAKIIPQRRLILIGFALGLAMLTSVGDLVIGILYDNRYREATWMMPILCCGVWFSVLFHTSSPVLLAIGKPLYSAQSNFAQFIMVAVGINLAFYFHGTLGAIIVIGFSDLPLYLVNLYGLWREKVLFIVQDIQATIFFLGVLTVLLVIRNFLGFGLPVNLTF